MIFHGNVNPKGLAVHIQDLVNLKGDRAETLVDYFSASHNLTHPAVILLWVDAAG